MTNKAKQQGGMAGFIPGVLLGFFIGLASSLAYCGYVISAWLCAVAGVVVAAGFEALSRDDDDDETERVKQTSG